MVSSSVEETKKFAAKFASDVLIGKFGKRKYAFVVALSGELGAGKTAFVQGFARGLGLRGRVQSPTFVFVRRYSLEQRTKDKGQGIRCTNFFHIDAYRLGTEKQKNRETEGLGLKEIFEDSGNVVLVEWAENVRALLPKDAVWVRMKHGEKENERGISISNF